MDSLIYFVISRKTHNQDAINFFTNKLCMFISHQQQKRQLTFHAQYNKKLLRFNTCCQQIVKMMDELKYQHWWITDGTWVLEFGGGELLTETVQVQINKVRDSDSELQPKSSCDSHLQTVNASDRSRTKFKDIIIHDRFLLTKEVRHRMEKVCGATNYSLALRNCEHLAR